MAATTLDTLIVKLTLDNSRFITGMATSMRTMDAMANRAAMVGTGLTVGLTLPLALVGKAAISNFSDFDDAMTKSLAIMDNVGDGMRKQMEEVAKSLSRELTITSTEAAESFFFLASAGFDAAQSIEALPIVANFATAGAFEMAQATDLLTDALSALGGVTDDTAETMANMTMLGDQLVKANTLANASVEQFSTALTTKAAASMRALNIETSQGLAVLSAYADQGIKSALAGSMYDRVLRLLVKSAAENASAHKAFGFEVFNAQGEMNTMQQMVGQLEAGFVGMSTQQKIATLTTLGFEARVQQAILPLIGMSDAIDEYQIGLNDAAGTMQEVADNQMESFASQMKVLSNEMNLMSQEIGEKLIPYLNDLTDIIQDVMEGWDGMTESEKDTVVQIAVILATLPPLLLLFAAIVKVIGLIVAGFAAVVASPIIIVIGLIVGAVVMLLDKLDLMVPLLNAIMEKFTKMWEFAKWITGYGPDQAQQDKEFLDALKAMKIEQEKRNNELLKNLGGGLVGLDSTKDITDPLQAIGRFMVDPLGVAKQRENAALVQMREIKNTFMGNLDTLGGLFTKEPAPPTAGQQFMSQFTPGETEKNQKKLGEIFGKTMKDITAPMRQDIAIRQAMQTVAGGIGKMIGKATELPNLAVEGLAKAIFGANDVDSQRGLFASSALQSLQGGANSMEERTAKATEETAKYTEKIYKKKTTLTATA